MTEKQDCIILPGRIPPKEIGFLNALLDDHEGIVVVRTVEATEGRMEFWVAPDLLQEFMTFVDFVNNHLHIPMEIYDPVPMSTEIQEQFRKLA
ncbi:MAG: DUF4911 domain-containing protein [bacterium]|jgi:hypothetical protein